MHDPVAPSPDPRTASATRRPSRRAFLLLSAAALTAACTPTSAPAPTTAAKPTEAPKPAAPTAPAASPAAASSPATAASPAAASSPSASPVAAAPAPAAQAKPTAPTLTTSAVTIPFYTTENDPASLDFFKRVGEDFKKQYPNIDLKITVYQDETQLQFLTTAFQTGTDLGIFAAPAGQVANWASQGFLLPLDSLIQKVGVDDFLPGTRFTVDGKDYGMPFQANASAVWYRKDLFQKAGLKPPTTYDDYLAAAQALNKDGILGIASTIGGAPQMALQFFQPYIYQSGWDYYDREGNLTFDKPEVLEAIKRYVAIMKNAAPSMYNAGFAEILNTYIAGRAAMGTFPGRLGVNLAAKAPEIADNTGVVPVPAGPVMTGKALFGSTQPYTVYAKTANPNEVLAFLEFLTTGDRELEFSMSVPGHLLPPLKSVSAKLKDYPSDYMKKHGDWVLSLADLVPFATNTTLAMGAMNNGKFEKRTNICPWSGQVWSNPAVDNTLFQEILIKNTDPEQAWKDASAKLKQIADTWKKENPSWKPAA